MSNESKRFTTTTHYELEPECLTGWSGIIGDLRSELDVIAVGAHDLLSLDVYIKQKYGFLRVYFGAEWVGRTANKAVLDSIQKAIVAAQDRSETACQRCGASGTLSSGRIMMGSCMTVLCPACRERDGFVIYDKNVRLLNGPLP